MKIGSPLGVRQADVTSPAPREVWQDLLKVDPEAVPYQTPEWLDCICQVGGFQDVSRLYEFQGGRQLILPLVRRRGLPTYLTSQASLPLSWGMGGLVGSENIHPDEIAAVFADLASLPVLRTSIRPNPRTGDVWAAARSPGVMSNPRLAHVIDLNGGWEQVWTKRFTKTGRNRIRKAERSGLVVERDTSGRLVPVFYDLLLRSFDRWASIQHEPRWMAQWRGRMRDPMRKFQKITATLEGACSIWVAWLDGQAAAASLVLQGANVNDSRGVMDKELAAPTCASHLIQSLAIEEACRAGCRYYHLGETGSSASLAHFKSSFGAQPYSYAEYYMERLPVTSINSRLKGLAKELIGFKDA